MAAKNNQTKRASQEKEVNENKMEYILFNNGVLSIETGTVGKIISIYGPFDFEGDKVVPDDDKIDAIIKIDKTLYDQTKGPALKWEIRPEKMYRRRQKISFYETGKGDKKKQIEIVAVYDVLQDPKKEAWNGTLDRILMIEKSGDLLNNIDNIKELYKAETKPEPITQLYKIKEKENEEEKKLKEILKENGIKGKKVGELDLFIHRYPIKIEKEIEGKQLKGIFLIDVAYTSANGLLPVIIVSSPLLMEKKGDEYISCKDIRLANSLFALSKVCETLSTLPTFNQAILRELVRVKKKDTYGLMIQILNKLRDGKPAKLEEVGGPLKYLVGKDFGYGLTPF